MERLSVCEREGEKDIERESERTGRERGILHFLFDSPCSFNF
jgi:hypothetical protein